MVWEGAGVVKSARKLIGATNPLEAEPGTIRGDFAVQARRLALPRLVTPPRLGCWSEGWDVATSVGGCEFPGCRLCHFLHPHPPMPFPAQVGRNVVHGSDSPENGERETGGWGGRVGWGAVRLLPATGPSPFTAACLPLLLQRCGLARMAWCPGTRR